MLPQIGGVPESEVSMLMLGDRIILPSDLRVAVSGGQLPEVVAAGCGRFP